MNISEAHAVTRLLDLLCRGCGPDGDIDVQAAELLERARELADRAGKALQVTVDLGDEDLLRQRITALLLAGYDGEYDSGLEDLGCWDPECTDTTCNREALWVERLRAYRHVEDVPLPEGIGL